MTGRKITVIGCGRWGSCIAWYLDRIGHSITLYGRENSKSMQQFLQTRRNEYITLADSLSLSTDLSAALDGAEIVVISIPVQNLRSLAEELKGKLGKNIPLLLCMKGLEIGSCCRPSQIIGEVLGEQQPIAVWLGPGHVQEFFRSIPNCMVIDSKDPALTKQIIPLLSGNIIRFYYGNDLIGNEIGAAAKNVVGIAAGMLDGLGLTTLKGALMSRGTREIARLIETLGGQPQSAYGLCHLGDYQATVFSEFSHNRRYGEAFVKGQPFDALAEGCYTVKALTALGRKHGVELPICEMIEAVLYHGKPIESAMDALFSREQRTE